MDVIRIERLTKPFRNGRKALDSVDLHVQEGEMIALIGASGSGKSPLLRHIAGFTASDPAPSHVTLLGTAVSELFTPDTANTDGAAEAKPPVRTQSASFASVASAAST